MSGSRKPEAFERFEKFARAIVRVPKREIAEHPASPTKAFNRPKRGSKAVRRPKT
jgi:hypothetical protein